MLAKRKKRVGIDARMIDWGGIGRYTQNLLKSLAEMEQDYQYILFVNEENIGCMEPIEFFYYKKVNIPVLSPYSQLKWTWELQKANIDLFHSPHFIWPFIITCPALVTIHDLIPLRFKEVMPSMMNRKVYFKMNRQAISKASFIICDSISTKKDIIHFFTTKEDKLRVINLAADPKFYPVDNKGTWENIQKKFEIEKPYIFASANPKPHKNLIGTIKAFNLIQKEKRHLQLVLYGPEDYRYPEVSHLIKELNLKNIVFTGFIPDEFLPLLYNQSKLFLFPSLYEGFGLPALEAMASGTPVITSNCSSLPEVVGKAAIMIDPGDIEEISRAAIKIIDDDKFRQRLVEKGFNQVNKFSWEKVGRETKALYDNLLQRKTRK